MILLPFLEAALVTFSCRFFQSPTAYIQAHPTQTSSFVSYMGFSFAHPKRFNKKDNEFGEMDFKQPDEMDDFTRFNQIF